jgi:GNAT superfamily N-acetyltransferase
MAEISDVSAYRPMFPSPECELLIDSVRDGHSPARLWTAADSRWALLWDRCNNVLYLGGDPASDDASELRRLVHEVIVPAAQEAGRAYFKGRGMTTASTQVLHDVLAAFQPTRDKRLFFAYRGAVPTVSSIDGVTVVPITRALIEGTQFAYVDEVVDEISGMWPSLEAFYVHGFGHAAIVDGGVMAFCTAEYMSRERCGIGIATAPPLRQKGIATLLARHFIAESLRRGIVPHWDCALGNTPSVRLAQKLGFELLSEAEFLYRRLPG